MKIKMYALLDKMNSHKENLTDTENTGAEYSYEIS
jgi:hypothetical protein